MNIILRIIVAFFAYILLVGVLAFLTDWLGLSNQVVVVVILLIALIPCIAIVRSERWARVAGGASVALLGGGLAVFAIWDFIAAMFFGQGLMEFQSAFQAGLTEMFFFVVGVSVLVWGLWLLGKAARR